MFLNFLRQNISPSLPVPGAGEPERGPEGGAGLLPGLRHQQQGGQDQVSALLQVNMVSQCPESHLKCQSSIGKRPSITFYDLL